MTKYFDKFPYLSYKVGKDKVLFTNILFRLKMLNEIKNNVFGYYDYLIEDGDTPEILAEKYYGDAEAHWLIILANDMVNPLFDWPLSYDAFNKYIISNYGTIENAQSTIHHYEIIKTYRTNNPRIENNITMIVDKNTYDNTPHSFTTYNLADGSSVEEEVDKNEIFIYDYEEQLNNTKRSIKLIKSDYYSQIQNEFNNLVQPTKPQQSYIKSLKDY